MDIPLQSSNNINNDINTLNDQKQSSTEISHPLAISTSDIITRMPSEHYSTTSENDILLQRKSFSYNNEIIIELKNIHKTYLLGLEGVAALRGINLKIFKSEFLMIIGTSGCGKTSLLNIIGTIDKPTKGDLIIEKQCVKDSTSDKYLAELRLNKISFVFQTFNLISTMTAIENVELPMLIHGTYDKKYIRDRAISLLTKVGLKNRINHFPNQLSGGEQQRVTIARALSNKPSILLLDEPTGDLDTKSSKLILKLLIDLNKIDGITLIMVTHDIGLMSQANRVVKMVDGKISNILKQDNMVQDAAIKNLNGELNYSVNAISINTTKSALDVNYNINSGNIISFEDLEIKTNDLTFIRNPNSQKAVNQSKEYEKLKYNKSNN